MTNLDSILKSRDITLPTKVHLVKAMVFPVVMYGCESWTIQKAEHWRTDAFKLWCWRRLLRVSWTARRFNKSILKLISPEYLLEGLMLKLQYFGHLMWRTDSLQKYPNGGKDWRQEEKGMTGDEMVSWHHQLYEFEQALGVGDGQGGLVCCSPWGRKESDMTEWLNWTEANVASSSSVSSWCDLRWVISPLWLQITHQVAGMGSLQLIGWLITQKRSFFLWVGNGVPCS